MLQFHLRPYTGFLVTKAYLVPVLAEAFNPKVTSKYSRDLHSILALQCTEK